MKKFVLIIILFTAINFLFADFYFEIADYFNPVTNVSFNNHSDNKQNKERITHEKKHKNSKKSSDNFIIKIFLQNDDNDNKNKGGSYKIALNHFEIKEHEKIQPIYYFLQSYNDSNNPFILLTNRQLK
ncbi:MAG: hypothetical protein N3E50_03815 [Candidatus Goldbacteria bacterium]|nr:hypothetical protein [Candidatus Goldiibacteriota bacterium]